MWVSLLALSYFRKIIVQTYQLMGILCIIIIMAFYAMAQRNVLVVAYPDDRAPGPLLLFRHSELKIVNFGETSHAI